MTASSQSLARTIDPSSLPPGMPSSPADAAIQECIRDSISTQRQPVPLIHEEAFSRQLESTLPISEERHYRKIVHWMRYAISTSTTFLDAKTVLHAALASAEKQVYMKKNELMNGLTEAGLVALPNESDPERLLFAYNDTIEGSTITNAQLRLLKPSEIEEFLTDFLIVEVILGPSGITNYELCIQTFD